MTRPARRPRALAVLVAVATLVVAVDQLTKTWALNALADGPIEVFWTLQFRLTYNRGAAFGLGDGSGPFVIAAAVVVLAIVLVVARGVTSVPLAVALGSVIGGALGNLTDRFLRDTGGAVVDFIDFQWWPVFNVADMAVVVGGIVAAVLWSRQAPDATSPQADVVEQSSDDAA